MRGSKNFLPILLTALLVCAAAATAGDEPVAVQRIWAPTGDAIGTMNHATLSFQSLDAHGDAAKGAEDWQVLDDTAGRGLFQWRGTSDQGCSRGLRAYATSGAGGLTGRYEAWGHRPGKLDWRATYVHTDLFYDTDSERRLPAFRAAPAPPALDPVPNLEWKQGTFALGFHPGENLDLRLELADRRREGDKSSLLREVAALGAAGSETPDRKLFDTKTSEIRLVAEYARGRLDSDAEFALRKTEGDRSIGTRQVFADDLQTWRLGWNLGYGLNTRTRLFGGVQTAQLKNEGAESRAEAMVQDGETKTKTGRIGLVSRLGDATTVRLAAQVGDQESDMAVADAAGLLQSVDRELSRTRLEAGVTHTGLPRTRIQARYRYRQTDLEELTAEGDLPGGAATTQLQALERQSTRHEIDFKARRKLSRRVQLALRADWESTDIEETAGGDDWQYRLGDRTRDALTWDLGLRIRPAAQWRLDAGLRTVDQTFERAAMPGVETTWKARQARLNLNWFAGRLTCYGMLAYGREELELSDDPVADGSLGALSYDGTTLRFAPGATFQLTPRLLLEAAYEGVRFEDEADASDALDAVEADSDRTLLRARYSTPRGVVVSATYRRHEFDENRWDDTIQDLYILSVSRTF